MEGLIDVLVLSVVCIAVCAIVGAVKLSQFINFVRTEGM
jgi:hypothetical protein